MGAVMGALDAVALLRASVKVMGKSFMYLAGVSVLFRLFLPGTAPFSTILVITGLIGLVTTLLYCHRLDEVAATFKAISPSSANDLKSVAANSARACAYLEAVGKQNRAVTQEEFEALKRLNIPDAEGIWSESLPPHKGKG